MLLDARAYAHVRQCIVIMSHTPQALQHFHMEVKMDEMLKEYNDRTRRGIKKIYQKESIGYNSMLDAKTL